MNDATIIDPILTDPILTDSEARSFYTTGDAAHDFDHIWRVTTLAIRIARSEGADVRVVRLAALLHDVHLAQGMEQGMAQEGSQDGAQNGENAISRRGHHFASAQFARDFLAERGLGTEQLENVVHCIEAHRFRDQSVLPQTLEAKCLYDADKLDSIGAIGIARAFAFAGAHGSRLWSGPWSALPPDDTKPAGAEYTPVHEYIYKLRRILATFYTESARRIGGERHRFMISYFDQLDAEMQGKS